MTRISLTEQYDDRDVIAQIVRLKDGLEDISGGVIADIQIVNNDLVIQWADGSSVTLPLPDPVTGISSITGSVSGGNLTITFYFTNGTTHSFTCPLSGMASETYVNTLDAQNVKLTGAQTIHGVKTMDGTDGDLRVRKTPPDVSSAVNSAYVNDATDGVNNIVHKTGNESVSGTKIFDTAMKQKNGAFDPVTGVTGAEQTIVTKNFVGEHAGADKDMASVSYTESGTVCQTVIKTVDNTHFMGGVNTPTTAFFIFGIDKTTGTASLKIVKVYEGSVTSTTVASL